jgi:hypothetical protein
MIIIHMSSEAVQKVLSEPRLFVRGQSPLWTNLLVPWIQGDPPRASPRSPWPYAAWWLTRQIWFEDADIDALHDRVGPDLASFIEGYAARMHALRLLNGQLWFAWMGPTCGRRVFGIVAGNEIPLLYLVKRPRRIVVTGPDGCFAPRLATWLADQHGTVAHDLRDVGLDALDQQDPMKVYWAEGAVEDEPWWPRVSALSEVVRTQGVRDVLDGYEAATEQSAAEIHRWFQGENLAMEKLAGGEGASAYQRSLGRVLEVLSSGWWNHPFPGGFEELTHVLAEALFTGYLPDPPATVAANARHDWSQGIDPALEAVRRQIVQEAWIDAGSISELARRLKVTRQTATRWAERYSLR